MKQKLHTADLVFDPTLACGSFRYPGVSLSLQTLSEIFRVFLYETLPVRQDLLLNRTVLRNL